jgi:chitosanase
MISHCMKSVLTIITASARVPFLCVISMGLSCTTGGRSLLNGELNAAQKLRAEQFTSVFENDTIELQYAFCEDIADGRGYTAGRAGFTTATGDVLEVVERYTVAVPGNGLAGYLPELRNLAESGSDDTGGLPGFPTAWAAAANDPAFRAEQDAVSDEFYYDPAVQHGRELGLTAALSVAELYDACIQHGDGDDPDGVPAMIDRAAIQAGGNPGTGVDETVWLSAFLDVRRATLEFATNPDTREGWADSVDRVDALRAILDEGNLNLDGPITINTPNHQATIP